MMDSGGANTTAAAAVLAAAKHLDLAGATALVLAATGPVGQRVAWLLGREGANVRVASRRLARATEVAATISQKTQSARISACTVGKADELAAALEGVTLIVAAGAAGVVLLPQDAICQATELRVAIDLNAVPPLGIADIKVTDKAVERNGVTFYGAIGVGGTKMKIHKAAIKALFEANDRVLDAPRYSRSAANCKNRAVRAAFASSMPTTAASPIGQPPRARSISVVSLVGQAVMPDTPSVPRDADRAALRASIISASCTSARPAPQTAPPSIRSA